MPANIVPDSEFIEIGAVGKVLRLALHNNRFWFFFYILHYLSNRRHTRPQHDEFGVSDPNAVRLWRTKHVEFRTEHRHIGLFKGIPIKKKK